MISTNDLAQILIDHHNVEPQAADIAAGLIIDENERNPRPLSELIAASRSGFPVFYRTARPETQAAPSTKPMSVTEKVALAAKAGQPLPDADVQAAMRRARGF